MGSFNFIPLPNAVPTAAKTASGASLETKGSLAAQSKGSAFQTLLTQAGEKLQTESSEKTVKFSDLPEELQKLIQEKFGITKDGEIQLIQLPSEAVRLDENGELRISLDKLENLLADESTDDTNSNFHFLDIKNADHLEQENSEESVESEGNVKQLVQSAFQDTTLQEGVDGVEFDEESIGNDQVDIHTIKLHQGQNDNSNQVNTTKDNLVDLNLQAKTNGKEISVDEQAKQNVIQLNGGTAEDEQVADAKTNTGSSNNKVDENTLQIRANGAESLAPKLHQSLEVTGELAQEIAKLEQANKQVSTDKPEYVIVKSPVQSNNESDKPVLFLINAKDIQVETSQSQKLSLLKSEMVNGEKSQTIDGQIKINFTPSEDSGEQGKGDAKDGDQPKNGKSSKLPELTQTAFQISKNLNEHTEAKRSAETSDTFRAQVKTSIDQTTLETKTAAQTVTVTASEAGNAGSSSSTQSAATTGQNVSANTTAQQTSGAQAAVKPSMPQELPQAYKDAATQQIVRGVQSSIGSERSHISIQLSPESLGKVDIQLKMQNGMMTAHIVAEKESTQAMLEKNAGSLKAALEEKNIQIDKVQIGRDSQEYRNPHQEQNRSNERWREYQDERFKDQNRERREQNEQQQNQQQEPPKEERNPWQSISSYMDRFFQGSKA